MLSKKIGSKVFMLLALIIASLSLSSLFKVSAACKQGQVKSIEEKIEEYAVITQQEASLTIGYARVAVKEKVSGRTLRASLRLDDARNFAKNAKNALAKMQSLVNGARTQRARDVLLIAIQSTIDAEREIRMAEAALSGTSDEVESSMVRAGSEFDLKLLSVIKENT